MCSTVERKLGASQLPSGKAPLLQHCCCYLLARPAGVQLAAAALFAGVLVVRPELPKSR